MRDSIWKSEVTLRVGPCDPWAGRKMNPPLAPAGSAWSSCFASFIALVEHVVVEFCIYIAVSTSGTQRAFVRDASLQFNLLNIA